MLDALAQRFPGGEESLAVILPLFLLAYLIPFFVAVGRGHRFSPAIGLVNVFLGWTVLGWLGAMIWAVNNDTRDPAKENAPTGPLYFLNEPRLNDTLVQAEAQTIDAPGTRQCPFCAETIKPAAVVCRHCGRDIRASAAEVQQSSEMTVASMEKHFEALQALLDDRDKAVAEKSAEGPVQPATNYEPEQAEIPQAPEKISADVVRELSGWKKFG